MAKIEVFFFSPQSPLARPLRLIHGFEVASPPETPYPE